MYVSHPATGSHASAMCGCRHDDAWFVGRTLRSRVANSKFHREQSWGWTSLNTICWQSYTCASHKIWGYRPGTQVTSRAITWVVTFRLGWKADEEFAKCASSVWPVSCTPLFGHTPDSRPPPALPPCSRDVFVIHPSNCPIWRHASVSNLDPILEYQSISPNHATNPSTLTSLSPDLVWSTAVWADRARRGLATTSSYDGEGSED